MFGYVLVCWHFGVLCTANSYDHNQDLKHLFLFDLSRDDDVLLCLVFAAVENTCCCTLEFVVGVSNVHRVLFTSLAARLRIPDSRLITRTRMTRFVT
ncbi:hypothetical protein LINPERPRIM_LOCUS36015 [Linum perenne]